MKRVSSFKLIFFIFCFCNTICLPSSSSYITIAILAKDKAHTLPLYLSCIEQQTWPKKQTYLYIRTNNNTDDTGAVLLDWVNKVKDQYTNIYFDDTDVAERVEEFKQHEWNGIRFKVLGKIRQDSLNWAYKNNSHYFVADCDNFIVPDTIETLVSTQLPIVAPLLFCKTNGYYSNYHYVVDHNGYYAPSPFYFNIYNQEIKGLIEVAVVHCTYLIHNAVLDKLTYDDDSWRYEYVIFSDSARKNSIAQYIDNRKVYGYVSFAETKEEFDQEQPLLNDLFSNIATL